jgi:hypothetical protein
MSLVSGFVRKDSMVVILSNIVGPLLSLQGTIFQTPGTAEGIDPESGDIFHGRKAVIVPENP